MDFHIHHRIFDGYRLMSMNTYFEDIAGWPRGSRTLPYLYATGFICSLILTLAAYFLAVHSVLPYWVVISALILLAFVQFAIQLICFLHLGKGRGSRDRLIVLCCALVIVVILVSGSLWIMFNLNQRMMPTTPQMEQYMQDQEGI
jgi:cytochrome o ubiquinol oxidase operon protein cyoD